MSGRERAQAPFDPYERTDWNRVQRGMPFVFKDVEDKHLAPIKPPVEVKSFGHARDLCAQYGLALYPAGDYEVRSRADGTLMLMHVEWHVRARMWQFQAPREDSVRAQFERGQ